MVSSREVRPAVQWLSWAVISRSAWSRPSVESTAVTWSPPPTCTVQYVNWVKQVGQECCAVHHNLHPVFPQLGLPAEDGVGEPVPVPGQVVARGLSVSGISAVYCEPAGYYSY